MAELAVKNTAINQAEDKLMCRHGFHRWILKDQKKLHDTAKKVPPVQRCMCCGKEKLVE